MLPRPDSKPTGLSTALAEVDTVARYGCGFQPISAARRTACTAKRGMQTLMKTSALLAFIATRWLSTVASVATQRWRDSSRALANIVEMDD